MSLQASGKVYEQRIASLIGGTHIKRQNYGETAPDVEHDKLVVEAKLRKTLSLETWMRQVECHREDGKICTVFCKQKNLSDNKTIVCIRLEDFLEILEGQE